ncbi:Serine kinase of the HPr protein, regulates carbohydrate metabolism [Lunatimonas lonarensis]|uniref:Serine kinase of the HPr protein, regulates carbohydrate metabolism n=1 Tax=Lunatimonas lonarensis TaxID=1232681 RepID=R7ZXU9_9BACT|nr:Serine kinase of the HPr protein, regulates carbohydrate metabolism [Lunatimonas lonarensis]EON78980.1 Serine kinase of the HPr protein, regulates carbohydrate metabolism [Lunatimonas lonarensis]
MTYLYTAFGLVIESDIFLMGMLIYDGAKPVDTVSIRLVSPTDGFTLKSEKKGDFLDAEIGEGEVLYKVEGTAHYLIREGREILVRPFTGDQRLLGGYIYGRCMTVILFQRNLFPFHSSAVVDSRDKLWMIVGRSHAGKSSTALMLSERGLKFFSDDMVLLRPEDGMVMASPTYPVAGIRRRTMEYQHTFTESDGMPAITEEGRTNVFFHNRFVNQSKQLAGVLHIRKFGEEIRFEKISSVQGMAVLKANINMHNWLLYLDKERELFRLLSIVCRQVPFWSVVRPVSTATYESLAGRIHKEIIR